MSIFFSYVLPKRPTVKKEEGGEKTRGLPMGEGKMILDQRKDG
jgi:hypothetical protein